MSTATRVTRGVGMLVATASLAGLAVCTGEPATTGGGAGGGGDEAFDVVIAGGRVLDPASGLDAIRNVGIRDGRIVAVTDAPINGETILDATGHVVAPGFIDLHVHGQTPEMYRIQALDGVTTSLELEVGTGDVAAWYAQHDEHRALINYGVSVGHIPARMVALDDPGEFLPSGAAASDQATEAEMEEMEAALQQGLDDGAVAVGFGWAYTPAATREEMERMMTVAGRNGASAHIHLAGGEDRLAALQDAMDVAQVGGAPLHVVHINSSGTSSAPQMLDRIRREQQAGRDITTEMYPYEAGMTRIESALFDDWESWDDSEFERHMWVETGERLTRETFGQRRAEGGAVIIFTNPPELVASLAAHPLTMIASDGFLENGKGHPRSAGTFSRVLGQTVRERGDMLLADAVAKMTIQPAQRLEARVPDMERKGRVQAGADADIVVFDPETIQDQATYTDPTATSVGMKYVLVAGVPIVREGVVQDDVAPGRAVRAPH